MIQLSEILRDQIQIPLQQQQQLLRWQREPRKWMKMSYIRLLTRHESVRDDNTQINLKKNKIEHFIPIKLRKIRLTPVGRLTYLLPSKEYAFCRYLIVLSAISALPILNHQFYIVTIMHSFSKNTYIPSNSNFELTWQGTVPQQEHSESWPTS